MKAEPFFSIFLIGAPRSLEILTFVQISGYGGPSIKSRSLVNQITLACKEAAAKEAAEIAQTKALTEAHSFLLKGIIVNL